MLTFDPRIRGNASAVLGILTLTARVDGGKAQPVSFDRAGDFLFDPGFATDGTDDGQHTITFTATDAGSTPTTADLSFTLDTQGPSPLTLDLAPEFVVSEDTTDSDIVTLVGQTVANQTVQLSPGGAQQDSDGVGDFQFIQVPLGLGPNDFTVTATDLAGNTSATNKTITRISEFIVELVEQQRFVTEASVLVDLGQDQGTRQLRFTVDTEFDRSDATSAVGDVLSIYLVDPNNPTQTLLDRGQPGTALFAQGEGLLEYPPGLVTFDGSVVEIEVSSLANHNQGRLIFQLLNHDTDTQSTARIGRISNELEPDGFVSPVFPLPTARAVPGGSVGDLSGLTPVQDVDVLINNVRFDAENGRYAADVRLLNRGDDLAQQISVTFPQTGSNIVLTNRSGLAVNGSPYVNMVNTIVAGGLTTGTTSEATTIEFTNADPEILKLVPQVFVGGLNTPPTLADIGALTMTAGERLEVQLDAADADGNTLSYSMFSLNGLPPGTLSGDGLLLFTPGPDSVGTFQFVVVVSDGIATAIRAATLEVFADPSGETRLTGRVIEEEDDDPIGGVPIELEEDEDLTDDMGMFEIEIAMPEGLGANLTTGVVRLQNGQFNGARATQQGRLVHVNAAQSPFGVGWGLAGWQQIVGSPSGSVLLIDGDGSESVFEPPLADGQPFVSPRGDFSTLVQMSDNTFQRTAPDQTIYTFNGDDLLASIVDRNGNETRFEYAAEQLTRIVDPVGLETTFSYTGDRVTSISHPGVRTTLLEYDGDGNLIGIIDPDTSERMFEYDAKNLLTAEITKTGFREETVFDFSGRVVRRIETDGGEVNVSPLQTQSLLPPSQTMDPFAATPAALRKPPITFHTDGNGNTVATELDRFGQRVFSFDGEGNRDRIVRDGDNLVTAVIDPRGFATRYQYDGLGNLTSISGDSAGAGSSPETATNAGALFGTRTFSSVIGNRNPEDFYRFELEEASRVQVRLTGMIEELIVAIMADADGDGTVNVIETAVFGTNTAAIYEQLPPGTYFVRIQPDTFPAGENTNYSLELNATELVVDTLSDPGNTLGTAMNLGTLQAPQMVRDIVGTLDDADIFEFNVTQNDSGVWIRLSQLAEDVQLRLIQDVNGNGTVDSGDVMPRSRDWTRTRGSELSPTPTTICCWTRKN